MQRVGKKRRRRVKRRARATSPASRPRVQTLLIGSLDERWAKYKRELTRCKKRCTEPAVHDLRVATRRLIATLDMVHVVAPHPGLRGMRCELKKRFNAFASLRDTQVQLVALSRMMRAHPVLRTFQSMLVQRERENIKKVAYVVRGMDAHQWERRIGDTRRRLGEFFRRKGGETAAQAMLVDAVEAAFAKTADRYGVVNPSDTSTIHRLRVAFKKFRYKVEVIHALIPGATSRMLKRMNKYQNRMGDVQDIEVLFGTLNAFVFKTRQRADESYLPVYQALTRKRLELIGKWMKRSDELFTFWKRPSLRSAGIKPRSLAG
jgi:CHAD domain-containing protein